ncbi:MAG: hypothetical protein H0V44_19245 [Planctomycetes bacterium]|nr:hypothetical protein [Planctomycetota bacterium]
MTYKIIYAKGTELKRALVEAANISEAMRTGYRQHHWDSVLEITTPDDQSIQGKG